MSFQTFILIENIKELVSNWLAYHIYLNKDHNAYSISNTSNAALIRGQF